MTTVTILIDCNNYQQLCNFVTIINDCECFWQFWSNVTILTILPLADWAWHPVSHVSPPLHCQQSVNTSLQAPHSAMAVRLAMANAKLQPLLNFIGPYGDIPACLLPVIECDVGEPDQWGVHSQHLDPAKLRGVPGEPHVVPDVPEGDSKGICNSGYKLGSSLGKTTNL